MIAKEMPALTLTFDESISAAKAEEVRKSLAGDQKVNARASGTPMWCGGKWSSGDVNGSWTIGYQCGSSRTLPWGYQPSAAVLGYVSESGLDRWRNGSFAGHLAPHVEPPDYHFHGATKPVYVGNDIDYRDLSAYRHTIGSGGTAKLSVAESVVLQN